MRLEDLLNALERIPKKGAVNIARRLAIIIKINQLMDTEDNEE